MQIELRKLVLEKEFFNSIHSSKGWKIKSFKRQVKLYRIISYLYIIISCNFAILPGGFTCDNILSNRRTILSVSKIISYFISENMK
jgi:hypothetical protein